MANRGLRLLPRIGEGNRFSPIPAEGMAPEGAAGRCSRTNPPIGIPHFCNLVQVRGWGISALAGCSAAPRLVASQQTRLTSCGNLRCIISTSCYLQHDTTSAFTNMASALNPHMPISWRVSPRSSNRAHLPALLGPRVHLNRRHNPSKSTGAAPRSFLCWPHDQTLRFSHV